MSVEGTYNTTKKHGALASVEKNLKRLLGAENIRAELRRFLRIYYDVMDNMESPKAPHTHTVQSEQTSPEGFADIFSHFEMAYAPTELRDALFDSFATPGRYLAHDAVGVAAEGTGHGHRYVVERDDLKTTETLRLFFIDPEHHVGKKHFLRPAILNLTGLQLDHDGMEKMFSLRVRTNTIDENLLNSFSKLEAFAKQLLESGATPETLSLFDIDPREIIYLASANEDQASLAARYTGSNGIQALHTDKQLPRFVQAKVASHLSILQRILKRAEEGRFVYKTLDQSDKPK